MPGHHTYSEELHRYVTAFKVETFERQFNFLASKLGGMNLKEVSILMLLDTAGVSKMRSIAKSLNLPLSTTTSVVDRMVSNHLVRRERTDSDRRVVLVSLTEKGAALNELMKTEAIKLYDIMLGRLSDGEQEELLRLFKKMVTGDKDIDHDE